MLDYRRGFWLAEFFSIKITQMKTFHIITIFPKIFDSYFEEGVLRRAKKAGKIEIKIHNLRDFTNDKHSTVDDTSYGGGPGMVLKVEPIFEAVKKIKLDIKEKNEDSKIKTVLFSAKGKEFDQKKAENLAENFSDIIMICGRYEGVDERVAENVVDEEISIGKYILTGGEIPAMVLVDSVSRLIPEVLGNAESLKSESHASKGELDYPVYTKPEEFKSWKVPEVLLSGDHGKIEEWRDENRKK